MRVPSSIVFRPRLSFVRPRTGPLISFVPRGARAARRSGPRGGLPRPRLDPRLSASGPAGTAPPPAPWPNGREESLVTRPCGALAALLGRTARGCPRGDLVSWGGVWPAATGFARARAGRGGRRAGVFPARRHGGRGRSASRQIARDWNVAGAAPRSGQATTSPISPRRLLRVDAPPRRAARHRRCRPSRARRPTSTRLPRPRGGLCPRVASTVTAIRRPASARRCLMAPARRASAATRHVRE